jgi:hypothetical protein
LLMLLGGGRLGEAFIGVSESPVWARGGEPRKNDGDGIVIISIQRSVEINDIETRQLLSVSKTAAVTWSWAGGQFSG